MRTLYLQCLMGAAGDMIMAALFELLNEDEQKDFLQTMNSLGLGIHADISKTKKCGILGTRIEISIGGEIEDEHSHHHHHHDDHKSLPEIEEKISAMPISDKVKKDASNVYRLLADAEAKVHDCEVSQIHFHEIGDADAIADIVGVCILLEKIAPENIVCSAINVGGGLVKCAHGILPVPAPATALLLSGIPIFSGDIKSELCTPTGAALIKYFAKTFSEMPQMTAEKFGYGMGKKDFDSANCLRAFLGGADLGAQKDEVIKLECNVDDMTGEALAFAKEILLKQGALDVWSQNIQMKKGRHGFLISCLCEVEKADFFASLMLKHTATFGVRKMQCARYKLEREVRKTKTALGEIRIKTGKGYGAEKSKPEYEDIAQAARDAGISFGEALEKAR